MVQDRRILRTQQGLAEALVSLCLEKGYAAVTIRDIAERAGVGYATFFRHYADKEALLADVFEVILAELLELLRSAQLDDRGHAVGALIFGFVAQHSEVCRALLSSRGPGALRDRIVAAGTANILAQNQPQPGSAIPPAVAAHHLAAATMALIQWWLDQDMPYSADRMGQIYEELVSRPTVALAFMPAERVSAGNVPAPDGDATG
jgi:AcrR family transcriptional regulator